MLSELRKGRRIKKRLAAGEPVIGAQIALADPTVVEILGLAGFDWLVVDTEHAAQTPATVKAMLQAGVATNAAVVIRPPRFDQDLIRLYLDLGAPGIICPFVESGDEAREFVQACRYPPEGIRGYGPRRAGAYGFQIDTYLEEANDSILCIPIIETRTAIENIDEIVAVDGIDGITIGPMDLSIELGIFQDFGHVRYAEAEQRVRDACARHGKAMGTGAYSLGHAITCRDAGDTLLLVLGDDAVLASGAASTLEALR